MNSGYFLDRSPRLTIKPRADAVSDGTAAIVSVTPSLSQGFAQPLTISVVVSGLVDTVTVRGSGAIQCSGHCGTLVGYDSAGAILGQTPLQLIDPADCSPPESPDNVTFGATATLAVTNGIIAHFDITPMSPLEFPVFDLTGHASATYAITLGVRTGPTLVVTCTPTSPLRGKPVTCTAMMSDSSAFVPTHFEASSDGKRIVGIDVVNGNIATAFP